MNEFQLWTLFNPGNIATFMSYTSLILAIWLSLRIAMNIRNSEEDNLLAKLMGTAFGAIVIAHGWRVYTEGKVLYINVTDGLTRLGEAGVELSPTAKRFIDYVGTTEPTNTPSLLGMAFLAVVAVMIVAQIWMPKKDA